MPSGYTSKLYESEQEFTDFMLGVSEAFMRSELTIEERKEVFKSGDYSKIIDSLEYYNNNIKDYNKKLLFFQKATDAELENHWNQEFQEKYLQYLRLTEELQDRIKRYKQMLKEVEEWNCGDDKNYMKLKEYAIEQLKNSINFDSVDYSEPKDIYEGNFNPDAYRRRKINELNKSIKYYEDLRKEMEARNQKTIAWFKGFMELLPKED